MNEFSQNIVILCGAISPEREVSLNSAQACYEALKENFSNVQLKVLDENKLPDSISAQRDVIFPVIHGDYGEDGQIQAELEAKGFSYAGCDSAASKICINKKTTKDILRKHNIPVVQDIAFTQKNIPQASAMERLGKKIVIKPQDKGSSVGLFLPETRREIKNILGHRLKATENWIAEPRLYGRELTIGLLNGKALGIVEIRPKAGAYDFKNKYTKGNTEYIFPAPIENIYTQKISADAEEIFKICQCRDFCRVDVILLPNGKYYFLEINTIPGLTSTSLLPKSASVKGLSFPELTKQMILPAISRFKSSNSIS